MFRRVAPSYLIASDTIQTPTLLLTILDALNVPVSNLDSQKLLFLYTKSARKGQL